MVVNINQSVCAIPKRPASSLGTPLIIYDPGGLTIITASRIFPWFIEILHRHQESSSSTSRLSRGVLNMRHSPQRTLHGEISGETSFREARAERGPVHSTDVPPARADSRPHRRHFKLVFGW